MDLLIVLCCLLLAQNAVAVLGQLGNAYYNSNNNNNNGNDNGNAPPLTLTPSLPLISHFINDSFIIFCKTVQKDMDTKWRDPNGQTRENTKGRVHIEKKTGFLALVFEHISLADKGNWTCEADAATQDAKKSFELLVNQKISFDKTEQVQSVREGHDAMVNCFVTGEPKPEVFWLHNGENINTVNSSKHRRLSDGLFIKNVSQTDAGEYTCRAMRITPTFSDSDQITILLRIQHKPHWFYNETLPVQYAYIGGAVNLSCDAMGEPPPSFTWQHNGKGIVGFNHRVFFADYGATLQLHIRNESQFGDYKCKVGNPLGTLERIIKLRAGAKPTRPTRFQIKRLYTDAFELDIRAPRMPNATDEMQIYGYRVAYMSESDFKYSAGNWSYAKQRDFSFHRGHRFIISHLEANTTYLMRVASRNLAGLSDWSGVNIFATAAGSTRALMSLWTWLLLLLVLIWH
ncbi:fasciclin-2 [Scaptodrosophila lebanonensis]|uniref:Fasciclin-2 n=1 Tax=Drosophila lebanonensis TaxID=7225 RepID=A0A6J2U7E6_DROLE|nr:fasciclin-2 [Scaptodrosophila lebanonensis]